METTTPRTGNIGTTGAGETLDTRKIQTDQVADRAHSTIDRATQGAHGIVDRVVAKAQPALDRAGDAAIDVQTTVYTKFDDFVNSDLAESAREEIRAHPLAVVGVALVAGLLIGRL